VFIFPLFFVIQYERPRYSIEKNLLSCSRLRRNGVVTDTEYKILPLEESNVKIEGRVIVIYYSKIAKSIIPKEFVILPPLHHLTIRVSNW